MNFNELSSTNMKTVTGCFMALGLVIFYCTATYNGKTIDWLVFGEMCTFAATFAGITGWAFQTQRKTDYKYKEIEGEALAKIEAAKATPAPQINVEAARTVNADTANVRTAAPVPDMEGA